MLWVERGDQFRAGLVSPLEFDQGHGLLVERNAGALLAQVLGLSQRGLPRGLLAGGGAELRADGGGHLAVVLTERGPAERILRFGLQAGERERYADGSGRQFAVSYDHKGGTIAIRAGAVEHMIARPERIDVAHAGTDLIAMEIIGGDKTRHLITFVPPLHLPDLLLPASR